MTPSGYQMTSKASNRLKTQGMASEGPSLDLFGYEIDAEKPAPAPKKEIKVMTGIVADIPVRPFSVVRINPTTVVIWNE